MKRIVEKNAFGSQLEYFLLTTDIKNATVADVLNYDVSYISKWTTGKSIPSAKNIDKICTAVSTLVAQNGSESGVAQLLSAFGVENRDSLQNAVKDALTDAYAEATGKFNESKYLNNSVLKVAPKDDYFLLKEYAATLSADEGMDIAVMVDLFALDHTAKLELAGIKEHKFIIRDRCDNIKLNYVIDMDSLNGHSVYDVLLLIHMMTNFSRVNYKLFYSHLASGKFMVAARDAFAGISIMGRNKQFMCTTSTRDKTAIDEMYDSIKNNVEMDKNIFFSTDMESLLVSHEYMQTMIAQDSRWLVGHITEHFISPELFAELKDQCFGDNPEAALEAERAYIIGRNAIAGKRLKIMMYSSAMTDYALSGELDFFNRKVVLTPEQRSRELAYMKTLLEDSDSSCFKLINSGFSDDFKYVPNPCIFLADSLDYLRLRNGLYEKNLMLVKDDITRHIFDDFFEEIWNYETDLIVVDTSIIIKKIDSLVATVELLSEVE